MTDAASVNEPRLTLEQAKQVLSECERYQVGKTTLNWLNGGDLIATGQIGDLPQENTVTFHQIGGHEEMIFKGDDAKILLAQR